VYFFPKQSDIFFNRIDRTVNVFGEDDYKLEGARVNAYRVALSFLDSPENVITGIGHGIECKVDESEYSHEGGRIANTFVNVIITWGVIGFFIYVLTFIFVFKKLGNHFFWLILLLHFLLGFYISYFFWLPIILIKVLFNEESSIYNR